MAQYWLQIVAHFALQFNSDGVSICEITNLSTFNYDEKIIGKLKIKGASGPHTIDLFNKLTVFDFYLDKFSIVAWYRRALHLVLRRLKKG